MRFTKKLRAEAEAKLAECVALQHAFWDEVRELEELIGCDIDDLSQDLENTDVDTLREEGK